MKNHLFTLALTLLVGCKSAEEPPPNAPSPEGAEAPEEAPDFEDAIEIEPSFDGRTVTMHIRLKEGFHAYAPGEKTGRPIRFEPAKGTVWSHGEAKYPEGKKKQTSMGPSVIIEKEAEASLPVSTTAPAPGPVKGRFHYQVCTDRACDRPRNLEYALKK